MAKIIRDAAIIVGVAALAVATYGASIGPTAAAAAGSAGIAALSVSTLATGLAIAGAGLTAIGALTAKKPSQATNPMEWQSNPQSPIPYVMGRTFLFGLIRFAGAVP